MRGFLSHPLKVMLVLAGLAFLFFSMGAHAYTDGVQVTASTDSLSLQPGTELPVIVQVVLPSYPAQPIPVSFHIDHPSAILVDGQLQAIDATFSLSRTIRVAAALNAPQGDYPVTIVVMVGTTPHSLPVLVHVGPKSSITYFTSPNTTLAPSISNVVLTPTFLDMARDQRDSFTVSFLHHGSATDYIIRFSEQPVGIGAHIVNATHHFVGDGQVVTSYVEVSTLPTTLAQTFPLHMEAYNQISGERMDLGTVLVNVHPTIHFTAEMPFQEYQVGQSQMVTSFITITNTEYGDQDVVIQASTTTIVPAVHTLNVPSKSSVSIPIQILGSDVEGMRSETLYVMNAKFTTSVVVRVRTVGASALPTPVEDSNSTTAPLAAGLVTGALSPWIGFAVIIVGALLVFSHDFRQAIRDRLPKPVPPAAKPGAKVDEKK